MLVVRERVQSVTTPADGVAELTLPFDLRQKSRLRTKLESGEDVALLLPRGTVLRGGDCLQADDGRLVRVVAQPERVMQVACDDPLELARAAYHLGNRHVPVQLGSGWLRLAEDHVLREMLRKMGLTVLEIDAPFEPEAGAYGSRSHSHEQAGHQGFIHEYSLRMPGPPHDQ
jgi:urease accessory protein